MLRVTNARLYDLYVSSILNKKSQEEKLNSFWTLYFSLKKDYLSDFSAEYLDKFAFNITKALLNNEHIVYGEPKYYVKNKEMLPKYCYLTFFDGKFGYGEQVGYSNMKKIFTKSWLKNNWEDFEKYNQKGSLEFEELI